MFVHFEISLHEGNKIRVFPLEIFPRESKFPLVTRTTLKMLAVKRLRIFSFLAPTVYWGGLVDKNKVVSNFSYLYVLK